MRLLSSIIAALLIATGGAALAQSDDVSYRGKVSAPEFVEGLEWLNTGRPLSMFDLRGKVVLLDFWTYCCVNCHHVLPDLKKLERKYPEELVVIGVHSGKFTAERDAENIRQAILRHEIEHPVVNDARFEIFEAYGAKVWPTIFLIDPAGKIVGYKAGEGVYEPFDEAIALVIDEFEGEIDRTPLDLQLESEPDTPLSYPGKVLADDASNQIFISDTNHNRIIVAALDSRIVKTVAGRGAAGLGDGTFAEVTFNKPQGMAYDGRYLYVADTENHAIRKLDLQTESVETIAGDGIQAQLKSAGGVAADTRLNSPWALTLYRRQLYVAMAGPHQIWLMDLTNGEIGPYAGSGHEGIEDGALVTAMLAQPSGMTLARDKIYFADSETSAIRSFGLPPSDRVETVVGVGLFDYGDIDGKGDEVRMQHPLDVAYHDGYLYVVDTYNNKIKRVDPDKREAKSFVGTGEAGYRDGGKARFDEPGGISYADGRLYVADTNNHVIRVIDLSSKQVSTFELEGLDAAALVAD